MRLLRRTDGNSLGSFAPSEALWYLFHGGRIPASGSLRGAEGRDLFEVKLGLAFKERHDGEGPVQDEPNLNGILNDREML